MLTRGLLLANAILLCGLTVIGWRNRSEPTAGVFALLEAVSAVWAVLSVVGLGLAAGTARVRIWGAAVGLSLVVVALWVGFIITYTGRDRWLRPGRFGLAAAPLLVGALLYGIAPTWQPLVGGLEQSTIAAGTVVNASIGPVGAVLGVYVYLAFSGGLLLVVKTVLEGSNLFVGQALAFLVGTLVTVAASVGQILEYPVAGYPLTQATLGAQALFWGYAVFREQFLRSVPGIARIGERAVFDEVDDGVLVVGGDGTVARANPKARAYLGEDPVGEPVRDLLARLGIAGVDDLPDRFRRGGRNYQMKGSVVTDWRGEAVGRALVVRDVTGLTRRQQRLEVLNRIMRHNLRNDMTVVRGCAAEIGREVDGKPAALSDTITETAGDLLQISEKAVEIDRMLEREQSTTEVDLGTFVDRHLEPLVDARPEATVETTVRAERLRTVPRLLSLALEEVVSNVIKHTGEAPEVTVEVTRVGDRVELSVADDGPGIPSLELKAVRAGTETDLEHGTSLGLWLVSWATQSVGGDVTFEADRGSVVTLSVPDLEQSTAEPGEPPPRAVVATSLPVSRIR